MRDTSLVYPIRSDGKILLGMKKRGMGKGKWNGFGGKIEGQESMEECAVRELYEESGLEGRPCDLIYKARLFFEKPDEPSWNHWGFVYFLHVWKGNETSSEEMSPRWFAVDALPYAKMWKADKVWLPAVLAGAFVHGRITFGSDGDTVTGLTLEEDK
ncbi:MAG TPA: 8-oxo-dGTP diphosphatase [Veillonellaceae bacterium]|jgi:8-oxo-dGTP diphosphatase|nr:8-oxo-dGTP diphosphatase [Veillonellaceae bacterium]